jgi:hypothetical protein
MFLSEKFPTYITDPMVMVYQIDGKYRVAEGFEFPCVLGLLQFFRLMDSDKANDLLLLEEEHIRIA